MRRWTAAATFISLNAFRVQEESGRWHCDDPSRRHGVCRLRKWIVIQSLNSAMPTAYALTALDNVYVCDSRRIVLLREDHPISTGDEDGIPDAAGRRIQRHTYWHRRSVRLILMGWPKQRQQNIYRGRIRGSPVRFSPFRQILEGQAPRRLREL